MNAVAHFEGVSGAVYVSIIAFSIVFAVLFGLTVMIFAMKLFAGSKDSTSSAGNAKGGSAAPKQPAPAAASAAAPVVNAASGASQGKIIAAITAAVLAASGGGRIMSITPAGASSSAAGETGWTRAWRANGVADLIARRARTDRGWRH